MSTTAAPYAIIPDEAPDPNLTRFSDRGPFARFENALGLIGPFEAKRFARRVGLYLLVGWVAPLILALFEHQRLDAPLAMPFWRDLETYARAFIAVPLLLLADAVIDRRLARVAGTVVPLARPSQRRRLRELAIGTRSIVASPTAEALLLAAAFVLAYAWRRQHDLGVDSWLYATEGGSHRLTVAGTWQSFVTVPLYLFLCLRWVWRWFMLAVFFFRVARLPIRLAPAHADRMAGLGFVDEAPRGFAMVIAAMASVASTKWLNTIVYGGVAPAAFTKPIIGMVVLSLVLAFLPMLAFSLELAEVKRRALRSYGRVTIGQVRAFERHAGHRGADAPVESEDSSTLCDMNSVYDAVEGIRVVPYRITTVVYVASAALVPALPVIDRIVPISKVLLTAVQSML